MVQVDKIWNKGLNHITYLYINIHMQYYVLKQFISGAQVWVWKLTEEDTGYVFNTEQEAEDMCLYLAEQDPSREYKVSTTV